MYKRIVTVIIAVIFLMNIYGCIALLAGAAGGAGTAVWFSEKLSQEVNAPYDRAIKAAESALKSLKLEVTKETVEKEVAQIMSKYTNGKTIWIDIRPVTKERSKVDVRVGAVSGDRVAADKILKRIIRYL